MGASKKLFNKAQLTAFKELLRNEAKHAEPKKPRGVALAPPELLTELGSLILRLSNKEGYTDENIAKLLIGNGVGLPLSTCKRLVAKERAAAEKKQQERRAKPKQPRKPRAKSLVSLSAPEAPAAAQTLQPHSYVPTLTAQQLEALKRENRAYLDTQDEQTRIKFENRRTELLAEGTHEEFVEMRMKSGLDDLKSKQVAT